jgi:hypothetical protein
VQRSEHNYYTAASRYGHAACSAYKTDRCVAQALVISSNRAVEAHLHIISELTHGVLFLGTPHRGSDLAWWASKLAQIVGIVKQTNSSVVSQLSKGSSELDRIQVDFDFLLRNRLAIGLPEIQLKCFFEEKKITGVGQVCYHA